MTNRNYRPHWILLGLFLCAVLPVMSACYTIMRHPRIAEADHQVTNNYRCLDCHTENEVYNYHHPITISRPPVDWDDALYAPWWYDAYWPDDNGSEKRYRDNLRPSGGRLPGGDTRIRTVKPPTITPPPADLKIDSDRKSSDEKRAKETPRSKERRLRPKKEKEKDKNKKKDG